MLAKFIVGLLLLSLSAGSYADETATGARLVVDKLNSVLIDVMKNAKALGYQGRYKKLEPVVKATHEFDSIAPLTLGAHWKDLSAEQKKSFVDKLTDLSIATYAAQFNGYGGEKFEYESEQNLKASRTQLRYTLTAPNEKPVKFEYILNQTSGQWMIINIVVDGISDLALKKAQYSSVMDREGFDTLLNKLSQKITDYAANNASSG